MAGDPSGLDNRCFQVEYLDKNLAIATKEKRIWLTNSREKMAFKILLTA